MSLIEVNRMPLKEAALTYVGMGWPVLPLLPNLKQPAVMRGLNDASTDPDQIERWWSEIPNCNIGLVTGVAFDALDLDGENGVLIFGRIAPGYKHTGPIQGTGKGYHLLFRPTGSGNHAGIAQATIDFRGTKGYIVGSPSLHPAGHRYQWVRDGELTAIPDQLHPFLFPDRKVRREKKADPKIQDALAAEKDIVGIFEEMGLSPRQWGRNKFFLNCPFHANDDTPSLVLYVDTNSFYCFGCDAWGDPLNVRKWQKTGKLH